MLRGDRSDNGHDGRHQGQEACAQHDRERHRVDLPLADVAQTRGMQSCAVTRLATPVVDDQTAASALKVSTPTRGCEVSSASLASRMGARASGASRAKAAPSACNWSGRMMRLAAATTKRRKGNNARMP